MEEERVWNPASYSYAIRKHLLESVDDFPIVRLLMDCCPRVPHWERYRAWADALGELGYPYAQLPYSGLGYLISRNFGVEKTVFASVDEPEETQALNDAVNRCNLRILDTILDGPFETLIISDNFDANVQTPDLFNRFSGDHYREVADRLHAVGKFLAVHVDGEMRGGLRLMAECGVDCVDAATPAPMFSLTPAAFRRRCSALRARTPSSRRRRGKTVGHKARRLPFSDSGAAMFDRTRTLLSPQYPLSQSGSMFLAMFSVM